MFATPEGCVGWLVGKGYSREGAEAFVKSGWVPSMVMVGGEFYRDVEAAKTFGSGGQD